MEEVRSSIEDATSSFGSALERGLGIERRGLSSDERELERAGSGAGDESPRRGKLLLGVANVGGSLTILLQIALVAWGVRRLRSMIDNRNKRIQEKRDAEAAATASASAEAERGVEDAALPSSSSSSRPVDEVDFALLSPVAVKRLVELDPVQYTFVDVRFPDAVKDSPAPFAAVINIPESELSESLQLSEAEWEGRYPSVRKIGQKEIIVFLSTKGRRAQRAAAVGAHLGYSGCCILSGGLEAYAAAMSTYVDVPLKSLSRSQVPGIQNPTELGGKGVCLRTGSLHLPSKHHKTKLQIPREGDWRDGLVVVEGKDSFTLPRGRLETHDACNLDFCGASSGKCYRDAVAVILEKQQQIGEESTESGSSSIHLLDVRRPDEREHFGHINGSPNIPVTELPKALTLDEGAWEKSYHFPKFTEADTLIFLCRINGRAAWGAQLAQDAGLKQCFVYKDGILGWRLDPTVKPYDAYKFGETAPKPIEFEVETVDHEAAREQLQQLGLGE